MSGGQERTEYVATVDVQSFIENVGMAEQSLVRLDQTGERSLGNVQQNIQIASVRAQEADRNYSNLASTMLKTIVSAAQAITVWRVFGGVILAVIRNITLLNIALVALGGVLIAGGVIAAVSSLAVLMSQFGRSMRENAPQYGLISVAFGQIGQKIRDLLAPAATTFADILLKIAEIIENTLLPVLRLFIPIIEFMVNRLNDAVTLTAKLLSLLNFIPGVNIDISNRQIIELQTKVNVEDPDFQRRIGEHNRKVVETVRGLIDTNRVNVDRLLTAGG